MKQTDWRSLVIAVALIAFSGCEFDAPITVEPTRQIDTRLLGAWSSTDWTHGDCKDQMTVRKYDDGRYILVYNGTLYRAWHSDVGNTPFVTVQNLDTAERKYSFFAWQMSEDGRQLTLRQVNADLIPREARNASDVAKFLDAHADDPKLFDEAAGFTRKEEK